MAETFVVYGVIGNMKFAYYQLASGAYIFPDFGVVENSVVYELL